MADERIPTEVLDEAGVYTVRGVHELHQMVMALAHEGFRTITVIDTQNGDYHVVAQRSLRAAREKP